MNMKEENKGYELRLAVLSIGLAGCYGDGIDGCHITYYDSRLRPYFGELVEGGFVIDKSAVLEAKPDLSVLSPLCKGSLPAGTRDAFHGAAGSIVAHSIANEPDNPAAGLARLMLAIPDCGAFDDVAPDVYAAWWAKHGARIGQRRGNKIVWADGTEEIIPPFAQRYEQAE
jgi:hypothetical protein